MTTINLIANLLVNCGLNETEAFEMAEHDFNTAPTYAELAQMDAEDEAYWAQCRAEAEEEAREWRALDKFFNEHIAGKSYDEMDWDAWGYYSDWYKDINGIRPRWYLEALYNEKKRAERDAVLDELEDDGWIMLTDRDGWHTYERQLSPSRMSIWRWDNWGMTFEAMERQMMKEYREEA